VLLASIRVLLAQPIAWTVLLASIRVILAQSVQPTARTALLASTQMLLVQPTARTVLLASTLTTHATEVTTAVRDAKRTCDTTINTAAILLTSKPA